MIGNFFVGGLKVQERHDPTDLEPTYGRGAGINDPILDDENDAEADDPTMHDEDDADADGH